MIADISSDGHAAATTIQRIAQGDLHRSYTNPRTHFEEAGLDEMHKSIEQHGIIEPLLGRPSKVEAGKIEIVAGERRWRGNARLLARLAGAAAEAEGEEAAELKALFEARSLLPVIVQELDDKIVLERQLIENLQRAALTPVEEARAYKRMLDDHGYTNKEIALRIGVPDRTVHDRLTLLRAPEAMLKKLDAGEIGERQVLIIAGVPDAKLREEAGRRVLAGANDWQEKGRALTVHETKEMVREHFMVSLRSCPWSMEDAELVKEAGPCAACQHLLANTRDPELVAEMKKAKGGRGIEPMTCMNPACHDKKLDAFFKRRETAVKQSGGKVLGAAEAKKLFYDHGGMKHDAVFVRLDAKPGYAVTGRYDDSKVPSYAMLIEKAKSKPQITICRAPNGDIVELMPKKAAIEMAKELKANGHMKQERPEQTSAQKREKEKQAFENKVTARSRVITLDLLHEKMMKRGISADEQLVILELMLDHGGMDGARLMAEWLKCEPEKPKKGSLNQTCYQRAILAHIKARGEGKPALGVMTIVAFAAKFVAQKWSATDIMEPLMKEFGFTQKDIDARATAAVKAEMEERKSKVKGPAVKPKLVSKSKSAARNAGVNAKDEKTRDKMTKGKLSGEDRSEHRARALESINSHRAQRGAPPLDALPVGNASDPGPVSFAEQVAMAKAKKPWAEIIGPEPEKGTLPHAKWTALRMKIHRAAKK